MRRPTRVEEERARRDLRRGDLRWTIVALVAGAVLSAIVIGGVWIAGQLRTANAARDALAAQVQKLGEKPIAGPPGSRGNVGPIGLRGPTGPPGRAGANGQDGADGQPGKQGATGAAGRDGANGDAGDNGNDGATGNAGRDGTDGANGADGATGPQGPQGERGEQGAQGEQGARGERGPAGPTCPDGYSLQPPPTDPDALVCRRDQAPTPQPDGDAPQPLSMAALDPNRRTWI